MKSRPFIALTLCALVANLAFAAAKKAKPEPTQYFNTRAIAASCDVVWRNIVPVIAKHGLMPDSSDRAGGFMRLRYTLGNVGSLRASREIKKLTGPHPRMFLPVWDDFRVAGASLSAVENGQQCTVMMQIEYQGFESNALKTWVALPSNNFFENVVLVELENAATITVTP